MSMNDFQLNELNHEDTHMELRAEGLVKRYGKRTVVNDVSIIICVLLHKLGGVRQSEKQIFIALTGTNFA